MPIGTYVRPWRGKGEGDAVTTQAKLCIVRIRAGPAKRLIICQPGLTLPFLRFYEFGLETWRFLPQGNREAADAGKFSLRVDLGEILAKYGKLEAQPRPVPL